MKQSEALRALSTMTMAYRSTMPDETLVLWSRSLVEYELEDLAEATTILAESSRFMPALADLRNTVIECRNDRLKRLAHAQPALLPQPGDMTFEEFLAARPDYRARVEALKLPGADMKLAAALGDPVARDKAARALAAAQELEGPVRPVERLERPPAPMEHPDVLRSACGVVAGTRAIQVDGVWVCPNCRCPISEGCAPRRVQEEEA